MVGVAIIGQGYMGRTHAEAWTQLGHEHQIRYVVSRGQRDAAFPAPQARFVSDLDIALSDSTVDVVSVCVPTALHAEFAIRALRAGKHVLVEKPIALTLADAHRLAAESRASGEKLMVAHVVRFFAGYTRTGMMAQAGAVGELHSVWAERKMARPRWSTWISDESQSGGVLVDFAIHDFDQANLLLGVPESVTSVREHTTSGIKSTITYKGGRTAEIITNAHLPDTSPFSSSIKLSGSQGTLAYQLTATSPSESGNSGTDIAASLLTVRSAGARRVITVPANKPYLEEIRYFLKCIESGTEPTRCTPESSITALAIALAARQSLRTHARVRL